MMWEVDEDVSSQLLYVVLVEVSEWFSRREEGKVVRTAQ